MSSLLKIRIAERGTLLSESCSWAKTSYRRLVGLLGHSKLGDQESMMIEPCKQVHTFFMRFPIDVVFLDKNNTVLEIHSMSPWRLSPLVWRAQKVLELPLGKCKQTGLIPGDRLELLDA